LNLSKKKAEGVKPSAGDLTHVGEPPNPHESVSKKTKGENETLEPLNPIKTYNLSKDSKAILALLRILEGALLVIPLTFHF